MRPNLGNSNWSWWAKEKMKKPKTIITPDEAQTEILDESETTDDVVESEVEVPTTHNKSRQKHKRRNK